MTSAAACPHAAMGNRGKSYADMSLFSLTRDLHHACEEHPVGGSMSRGDVHPQHWADWLGVLHAVHSLIDPEIDPAFSRVPEIERDMQAMADMGYQPRSLETAAQTVDAMKRDAKLREAAHYVITGAHLMGGQVMRVKIGGRLPTEHLVLADRPALMDLWAPIRERVDLADHARGVFRALLDIMDEMILLDFE